MDLSTTPHVLAIGEALIDVVITPDEPDFPQEIPGGSPANVALTLGRLGRPVALSTWIGADERGRLIEFHLRDSDVEITPESRGASRTSTALARLDAQGQASYTFDLEWAPASPLPVSDTAVVVQAGSISSVIEPGAAVVLEALERSRAHALVVFDPNARPSIMGEPARALATIERFVAVSDIVKVSDEDVEWLTEGAPLEDTIARWLGMGPSVVVVTRGKHGSLAVTASGVRLSKTPNDVPVVDTVGAGDSFTGGIIDALWELGLTGAGAPVVHDHARTPRVKEAAAQAPAARGQKGRIRLVVLIVASAFRPIVGWSPRRCAARRRSGRRGRRSRAPH